MKYGRIIVFLFFAVLWSACHRPAVETPYPVQQQELSIVDSLMWTQPDSALTRLLSCYDTIKDRHYANLLLAELLYKNYYEQTNRAELLKAVAYYDSASCPFLAARAHYINGVGYYEHDSVVPACEEYLKALEIMEEHFPEKELVGEKAQFMAMTCTHLCGLFSDQYLHEQAIYFGKQALLYYDWYDANPWHKAWVLDELGSHYEMLEQWTNAKDYYQKAYHIIPDTLNMTYRDIKTRQLFLSYKTESQESICVIKQLKNLLVSAENEKEYLARCLAIGEIFYCDQQFDSAWAYLQEVYGKSTNLSIKKQASEWLVEICKARGKESEAYEYASFLVPFANQEENKSAIKSHLTELYNIFCQKKITLQHQALTRKQTKQTIVVVLILFIAILTVSVNYLNKKRKHRAQLEAESYSHEIKQKALSGRLRTSNKALREALQKLEKQKTSHENQEDGRSHTTRGNYETLIQTSICQEIVAIVNRLHSDKRKTLKTGIEVSDYKDFALSTTQLSMLTKAVETNFPCLFPTIKALYPNLNRNDWLHCCLFLMQLDKMSICVLLQEPYYTCRRHTLKMEKAFDCHCGLSAFLFEQAENC